MITRRDFLKSLTLLPGVKLFGLPRVDDLAPILTDTDELPKWQSGGIVPDLADGGTIQLISQHDYRPAIKTTRDKTVFMDWSDNGDDNNDGLTPETAVESWDAVFDRLDPGEQQDVVFEIGDGLSGDISQHWAD